MSQKHHTPIQLRLADFDLFGHVNNVNQQHYFDLGKSDLFAAVLGLDSPKGKEGMVVVATACEFLEQIRPHERVEVVSSVKRIGTKSLVLSQQLIAVERGSHAGQAPQRIKSRGEATLVAFDFERQCSIPLPERWREALKAYLLTANEEERG